MIVRDGDAVEDETDTPGDVGAEQGRIATPDER